MSTGPTPGPAPATTETAPVNAPAGGPARATLDTGGAPQTPPAGDPPAQAAGDGAGTSTDWAGPEKDNQSLVASKGWKSPADVVKSYAELSTKLGGALTVPGADATPEEIAAFHKKAGAPENADGYPQLALPEGTPADMPYDQAFTAEVRVKAAELGLTPRQLQGLHDWYVGKSAEQFNGSRGQVEARADSATADLAKAWGAPGTDTFQRNQEMALRAVRNLGDAELMGELKSIGAISAQGFVLAPKLMQALAKVGTGMFAEDTMFGSAATTEKNPFSDEHRDRTRMSELVKQSKDDPRVRAYTVALIKSAGQDPSRYGFN